MMVRNWMQANPLTITSDMLVSEAKRVLAENNLHALPVVDDGMLRGLVTRANLLRTGHFVLRTQNPDELNFFVTRLKVKDIMVRNPATVQASNTMEQCLAKGRELGVAQFPVLDGERLVGVISANEIFQLAAHCLGAWERRNGVTLAPLRLGPGVLGRIADVAESAGACLQALYPIGGNDPAPDGGYPERKVTLRFHARDFRDVVAALEAAGFPVLESTDIPRATSAARA
jgi:acetoin utilization protein AcuB